MAAAFTRPAAYSEYLIDPPVPHGTLRDLLAYDAYCNQRSREEALAEHGSLIGVCLECYEKHAPTATCEACAEFRAVDERLLRYAL